MKGGQYNFTTDMESRTIDNDQIKYVISNY